MWTLEQQILRSTEVRELSLCPRDPAVVLCIAVPRTLLCSRRYHKTGTPRNFQALLEHSSLGVIWDWCNPSSTLRLTCKLLAEPHVRPSSLPGMKELLPFYLAFSFSEWTYNSFTWNWTTTIWLSHFFPLPVSKAVYSSKEDVDLSLISYLWGF